VADGLEPATYSRRCPRDLPRLRPCPTDPSRRAHPESSTANASPPGTARLLLGDIHYNAPNVRRACLRSTEERFLVTTERGAYPHTDDGVEVRRIFHKLRSVANENFNEHFEAIFEVRGQILTRGLINTQRFALGAVLVY
jgi:hypothetical protein